MISATATPSSSALCASIGPAIDVADGVDAGDVGAEMRIDDDAAAIVLLHAGGFEAEPFGVRHAADRDQHDVGLERLRAPPPAAGSTLTLSGLPEVSTAVTFDDSLNARPCFCSMRWNCRADLAVDAGQNVIEKLDDRHLARRAAARPSPAPAR